jgi:hypothetical protein
MPSLDSKKAALQLRGGGHQVTGQRNKSGSGVPPNLTPLPAL